MKLEFATITVAGYYNSIKVTIDTLNKILGENKVNLLFACAIDKDIEDIAGLFKYRFNKIYVTRPGDKKQSDINREKNAMKEAGLDFSADADYKMMIKKAFEESCEQGVTLLVTGSFYLVAEVVDFMKAIQ